MTGICGWIRSEHDVRSEATDSSLTAMAGALGLTSGIRLLTSAFGGIAANLGPSDSDSLFADNGLACVVIGQPRLRSMAGALVSTTASGIAATFRRVGPEFLRSLSGHFAVAIHDRMTGETVLAIDRIGVFRLTYRHDGGRLLFGSRSAAIHAHPDVDPQIRVQAILNYAHFHMVPGPETMFEGERMLEPGEYLHFRDGQARVVSYWRITYHEDRTKNFSDWKRDFVSTLQTCVGDMLPPDESANGKVGCFMSGGTDSSTIAGMVGRVRTAPVRTYSIGFAVDNYDEMAYARIAAKHFRTIHHEYYVTPNDVILAIPRIVQAYDQPFANASAVPTYYCAKLARDDGIDIMLGGDGGDELFGGNERYATQTIFSWYARVPRPFREGLLEPMLAALPAAKRIAVLQKAKSYVSQARVPMPDRYHTYSLMSRFGAENVFTPEILANINPDEPLQLLREEFEQAVTASLINQMQTIDLRFTLASNDLPKVTGMCAAAGVIVRFPMLDDRLVDLSTRLPSDMKLKRTTLRYFFKRALSDFLPPEIIAKQKHGFGLPIGHWLRTHQPLRAFAEETLQALKSRDIFRAQFIDRIQLGHREEHAAYFGAQIWMLMMLELWMRRRKA